MPTCAAREFSKIATIGMVVIVYHGDPLEEADAIERNRFLADLHRRPGRLFISATTAGTPNATSNLIIITSSYARSKSASRAIAGGLAMRAALATARGADSSTRPPFYFRNERAVVRGGFEWERKIELWNIAKWPAENSAYAGKPFPTTP